MMWRSSSDLVREYVDLLAYTRRIGLHTSWPGLTRLSGEARAAIDGRVKPGHDA